MSMNSRTALVFFTTLAIARLVDPGSEAKPPSVTVRAKFSFDALADCEQPSVKDFQVHAEGTGALSTDRTATLDMQSNVEGHTQIMGRSSAPSRRGSRRRLRLAARGRAGIR